MFNCSTPIEGEYFKATSHIPHNGLLAQGNLEQNSYHCKGVLEQLQLAMVGNIGMNDKQFLKQRALLNVLTSNFARGDMRQVLQSRAEIYGECLDPNWFVQNSDVGGKTRTILSRIKARSMLVGAPLLVAQNGALELRRRLMHGDIAVFNQLDLNTKMTVGQVLEKLKAVPPLAVLKLCDSSVGDFISESLAVE